MKSLKNLPLSLNFVAPANCLKWYKTTYTETSNALCKCSQLMNSSFLKQTQQQLQSNDFSANKKKKKIDQKCSVNTFNHFPIRLYILWSSKVNEPEMSLFYAMNVVGSFQFRLFFFSSFFPFNIWICSILNTNSWLTADSIYSEKKRNQFQL